MNGNRYSEAGAVVRAARQAKGLTQEQMAERIGRDQSYISRIECGDVAPGRDTLVLLTRELGAIDITLWDVPAVQAAVPEEATR